MDWRPECQRTEGVLAAELDSLSSQRHAGEAAARSAPAKMVRDATEHPTGCEHASPRSTTRSGIKHCMHDFMKGNGEPCGGAGAEGRQ